MTWSLSDDDRRDFSISIAGVLSFSTSPDYESPAEANMDEEAGSDCSHKVSSTLELMSEEMIPLSGEPNPGVQAFEVRFRKRFIVLRQVSGFWAYHRGGCGCLAVGYTWRSTESFDNKGRLDR